MDPSPPEKAFSMGIRPATCSTGDVCMALDYLEDPAVHGITTQVRDSCRCSYGRTAAPLPVGRAWRPQVCPIAAGCEGLPAHEKAVQPALPW